MMKWLPDDDRGGFRDHKASVVVSTPSKTADEEKQQGTLA
jgi:hypothetical protein